MSFNFSFGEAQESINQKETSRISEPGMYQVILEKAEYGVSENSGNEYMDFTFKTSENETHRHRVWAPKPDSAYVRDGETQEEAGKREINERLAQIVQIATPHLGGKPLNLVTNSFADFCTKVSQKIKSNVGKVNLTLKLILDSKKEYVQVPRYGVFIERYEEGSKSRLKFSKWERENALKRPQAPENVLDNSSEVEGDDFPF